MSTHETTTTETTEVEGELIALADQSIAAASVFVVEHAPDIDRLVNAAIEAHADEALVVNGLTVTPYRDLDSTRFLVVMTLGFGPDREEG